MEWIEIIAGQTIGDPAPTALQRLLADRRPSIHDVAQQLNFRAAWSESGKELISVVNFKTANGQNAELTVARKLTNGGKILVLTQTLRIEGDRDAPPVHRVWQRKSHG